MDEIIHMENHTKKLKKKIENRKSIDISSYKHSLLDFKIGHSSDVGKSFMLCLAKRFKNLSYFWNKKTVYVLVYACANF